MRVVAAAPVRRVSTAPVPVEPSPSAAEQCAREAEARVGARNKTVEVVKDGAVGAVVGALVGAAGGAIADGGSGAGKGAAIGGVLGAGSGAVYGVYGNGKHDERVREAQAACLRTRGLSS